MAIFSDQRHLAGTGDAGRDDRGQPLRAVPVGWPGWPMTWKIVDATNRSEAEIWARLNARLTPDCFRSRSSASPVPRTQAATVCSVSGSRNRRKATPGTSLKRERCTFAQEVYVDDVLSRRGRTPTAANGRGRNPPSGSSGPRISRTTARFKMTATAAINSREAAGRSSQASAMAVRRKQVTSQLAPPRSIGRTWSCSRAFTTAAIVTLVQMFDGGPRQCPACGAQTP